MYNNEVVGRFQYADHWLLSSELVYQMIQMLDNKDTL
jgi:hypothetical protein